jgi:pimeloyl-ACP methyl ester carboxylesterase
MINRYLSLLILTACLFAISCDLNKSIEAEPFEFLVSESFNRTITQDQLNSLWTILGVPEAAAYINYDVDIYRVVYTTMDRDGSPIEASGAILVPKGLDNPGLLSIQHATIFSNNQAPSVDINNLAQGVVSVATTKALFASLGYITFLPDYIGYGVTDHLLHPYQQQSTLASASYDMIRAGLEFVDSEGLTSTNQPVNLIGYSEGAYATLALSRLIETTDSGVDIGLVSMGAPIFDLTNTMDYIIENISEPMECVACYGYFLYTYHQLYELPRPLSDYFNSPYDQIIADGLFDGGSSANEVNSALPEGGDELFTENFILRYLNGEESELLAAVGENDLLYVPNADVILVHGDEDGVAPIFNSDDFETRALSAVKTNLTYIREEGVTHGTGFIPWGLETLNELTGAGKLLVKN